MGSIPESERSSGEGIGNTVQYSCMEISMDRRAWRAIVHGVTKRVNDLANEKSSINDSKLSDGNLGCTLQPLGELYIVKAMVFPVSCTVVKAGP